MSSPRQSNRKRRTWTVIFALLLMIAVIAVVKFCMVLSEVGVDGLIGRLGQKPAPVRVHLKPQPVYRIKKQQEMLGVNIIRIVSRQQPEEFLVMDNVPGKLVNEVYGKPVNLTWANTIANQLTRLRESDDDGAPQTVDIQEVKTVKRETFKAAGREMPAWWIRIRFRLGNEGDARTYDALVVRNVRGDLQPDNPNAPDSIVVGYAQHEAFQKNLVADLLKNLRYTDRD